MPEHFAFRSIRRGGAEYAEMDWRGDLVLATLVEASRLAINDVTSLGAEMARTEHMWENRTGQTEEAVFTRDAEVEWHADDPNAIPHVWGEWGVEDRPRFDEDGEEEDVSTKDVAMFLEFGTVRMDARPWLYPAWDSTKVLLPRFVRHYYRLLTGQPGFTAEMPSWWRPRGAKGRFVKL